MSRIRKINKPSALLFGFSLALGGMLGVVSAEPAEARVNCTFTYCNSFHCDPTGLPRDCVLWGPICDNESCD